ncbi:glycosyltransferase family 2 protein [Clostridium perfringens]|uniref:glycosyltransferase family 2 protein n=1 Tax=Clostridium perfringens TaxID=1502 RepID=UPI001C866A4D|nr:glycosyltransferase [Clostridium perfringens]ELC8389842.1 glycosyltransferase [Clostridium perfringens]
MNKPLVSIIIPVYNSEKYLKRCLDSAINQSEKNIEIIIINDGSKDNSLNIAMNYSNKDNRINIINKKNGGISSARNCGLKYAKGKYVTFLDSDDWIELNMIEEMLKFLVNENTFLIQCRGKLEKKDENIKKIIGYNIEKNTTMKVNENLIMDLLTGKLEWPVWNMLINREFLLENNITFNENCNHGEDFIFTVDLYKVLKNITFLKSELYHYYFNSSSLSNNVNKKIDRLNWIIIRYYKSIELLIYKKIEEKENIEKIKYNCTIELIHKLTGVFMVGNFSENYKILKEFLKKNEVQNFICDNIENKMRFIDKIAYYLIKRNLFLLLSLYLKLRNI